MNTYLTYDAILENCESDQEAIDYARGIDWSEYETHKDYIKFARLVDTVDGINVYYYDAYGADYYFFGPNS